MGFSVSGSAAIVFAGVILAGGILHGAVTDASERVRDSEQYRDDSVVTSKNTGINVTAASYDSNADELTVTANNTGARPVSLNRTDIIVENEYQPGWQDDATVAGRGDSYLWLPGEQLRVTIGTTDVPARVKLVTEGGIADTVVVE